MTWPWEIVERDQDRGYVALDETVARFEGGGFATTGVIGASDDDLDHYESQHWRAIEEWLAEHPEGPRRRRVPGPARAVSWRVLRVQASAARLGDLRRAQALSRADGRLVQRVRRV
jgi:hypothetical protein